MWQDWRCIANFQQLRQKCVTLSAPLKSANGKLLSDSESVVARWQEYFSTLLNWCSLFPPDALVSEARASRPDPLIDTSSPTVMEMYKAVNRIKAGKAPGSCDIYPEYYPARWKQCNACTAQGLVWVWEDEVAPEEWHQGIITPLYEGKGSRWGYRGITLLSVPGKVFAHVILSRIRPNSPVSQTAWTEWFYARSLQLWPHSYSEQYRTMKAGFWSSNLRSVRWPSCCFRLT